MKNAYLTSEKYPFVKGYSIFGLIWNLWAAVVYAVCFVIAYVLAAFCYLLIFLGDVFLYGMIVFSVLFVIACLGGLGLWIYYVITTVF